METINYNDIEPIVEKLIKLKRHEWKTDVICYRDVAQEIRIFCSQLVKKIDKSKCKKIESFLNVCISNFIKKYSRDKLFYYVSPCMNNCKFYTKEKICINSNGQCKAMRRFLERKRLYNNFHDYISIDDTNALNNSVSTRDNVQSSMDVSILQSELEKRLNSKQIKIYYMWRDGYSIMDISNNIGYNKNARGHTVRYHIKKIKLIANKIIGKYYD